MVKGPEGGFSRLQKHMSQSQPKVHSGFHAAWQLSGLKDAVMQLIKLHIPPETAAKMHVFLTGIVLHL